MTPKSEPAALEPKEELSEQDAGDQDSDTLREELQSRDELPPHDSEDSLGPEHVADELRRLTAAHPQMTGSASTREPRGATAPGATWETHAHMHLRDQGEIVVDQCPLTHSCFTQRYGWSMTKRQVHAHEEPREQLRDQVCTMEANLETLRTRLTQVAHLQHAQGLREDHRALIARLTEIEECASVHALREFMTKILRLESMLCDEQGGTVGEAIRACNRRLDNHRARMDDFYAAISNQDWYHDLSDQEDDEEARQSTARAKSRCQCRKPIWSGK